MQAAGTSTDYPSHPGRDRAKFVVFFSVAIGSPSHVRRVCLPMDGVLFGPDGPSSTLVPGLTGNACHLRRDAPPLPALLDVDLGDADAIVDSAA